MLPNPVGERGDDEMKRKDQQKKAKKKLKKNLKGILGSILFTLIVPIGFVFLMGLLSQSFPVLYYYTKQIFIGFVLLVMAGICLIIYQIYRYITADTNPKEKRRKDTADRQVNNPQAVS